MQSRRERVGKEGASPLTITISHHFSTKNQKT